VSGVAIPIKLTLAEVCAIALNEAAEALDGASDADAFLVAIETNHRLWLTLTAIANRHLGDVVDERMANFVISMSYKAGRGIPDQSIEALIGINNELASTLTAGQDLAPIRRRAELAWKEAGGHGMALRIWLLSEIDRKTRIAMALQ
jgi:hypothetical protein